LERQLSSFDLSKRDVCLKQSLTRREYNLLRHLRVNELCACLPWHVPLPLVRACIQACMKAIAMLHKTDGPHYDVIALERSPYEVSEE
jgi:hypothetical protein